MSTDRPQIRTPKPRDGRHRVQIEGIAPSVNGGRFPAKGIQGDPFPVEADIFADGHDRIEARLLHRRLGRREWEEVAMLPLGNDRWRGTFTPEELGAHQFTIQAWVDPFLTWRTELEKWIQAGVDVSLELEEGARLVEEARDRADEIYAGALARWAARLRSWAGTPELSQDPSPLLKERGLLKGDLPQLMTRWADRSLATRPPRLRTIRVDRERAAFSAWYEFFPRSTAPRPGTHGTFRDAEAHLPYIQEMGFDVVYLPPIHPIGTTNRKGPNNQTVCDPDDPGSPWAIGATDGGHTAIHPELGTLDDFRSFREKAEGLGMEVALDIAFQCSPDHPWVKEHPQWFRHRPDGSIRYAENPPKKYQDIYPLDFETEDWEGLWDALLGVFLHWMAEGVRIFRVDNPHTKAFPFWEWAIRELRDRDPGVILLSEAFTRPRIMYRLAKLGYTQSYTYFTWRNTKQELEAYLTELTRTQARHFFRPNFWPNTPDILTEFLQTGGRPAFMLRLVLAGTLTANYGIYGPPFELVEHTPREPGSEEYLDSEKYQLRHWNLDRPDSLREFISRVNRIRKENPALHRNGTLHFHSVDNDRLIVYSKMDQSGENRILVVVNLDPHHTQSGWVEVDHARLGLEAGQSYGLQDLLAGGQYLWEPDRNFVRLDPQVSPAHIFQVSSRHRNEADFEYF